MRARDRNDGPPTRLRDLIPGSRLATMLGDLRVPVSAVCDGDDTYEVNATVLGTDRAGRFDATESLEPWMLPETELEFLRCVAGRDDANYVEDFISNAEKNHWFGEKCLFLDLNSGKTILNRRTKLVLHCNPKPQEKTLNHRVLNASKPLKRTNYVLEEQTKPYNVYLNANNVPTYSETPADQRRNENRPAPAMHPRHQQQQSGIFIPAVRRPVLVYRPVAVVPCLPPGFVCQQNVWTGNFYRPFPVQRFPQPLSLPPPPMYFTWGPINNTQAPPSVVTAQHHKITYSHTDNQQKPYEKNEFVDDECINKIVSTIETKDKNALRSFLLLLKSVYPKKLEEFDKIMTLMDYINSQLPM
ncbi:uncharacterized protein LOC112686634 isoform X2 [Sipha flava]|uniref:Uncharacterized protein LOC112686634 isoform X2 n=2 Tax=Sipha flava TaxID=143950 RepID=A0A8B8FWS2_9HEMI|nr:uncharacterized protein LOC112686634 isoform X2 [Sipha flava]